MAKQLFQFASKAPSLKELRRSFNGRGTGQNKRDRLTINIDILNDDREAESLNMVINDLKDMSAGAWIFSGTLTETRNDKKHALVICIPEESRGGVILSAHPLSITEYISRSNSGKRY